MKFLGQIIQEIVQFTRLCCLKLEKIKIKSTVTGIVGSQSLVIKDATNTVGILHKVEEHLQELPGTHRDTLIWTLQHLV